MRMWARQEFRVERSWYYNSTGILRLAGEPWNRDLSQWRHRLSNHVQVYRRVALPLLRYDFRIAFDEGIFRTMSATRGKIPDGGQLHLNHRFHFGFKLRLRFLRI